MTRLLRGGVIRTFRPHLATSGGSNIGGSDTRILILTPSQGLS